MITNMKDILIVDDKKNICKVLKAILEAENYNVDYSNSVSEAIKKISKKPRDLIISDIRMPDINGLEFYELLLEKNINTKLIFMTAFGSIPMAVEAMKMGASEFLTKPIDYDELKLKIFNLIGKGENIDKRSLKDDYPKIIGQSQAVINLIEKIEMAADYNATVLIQGESGTGKELVARALHEHSHRADNNFVAVNCAALGEYLIESELFGHKRGAFTGAVTDKKGKFELAAEGSILLDEISEIPLNVQAKLLRVLQEREFERVGENRIRNTDARVIATTNKELSRLIEDSTFREDLFYRLNVIPISIPPLRERKEDIELLVDFFQQKFCEQEGISEVSISEDVLSLLNKYNWPGNVRELKHLIERLIITTKEPIIRLEDIERELGVINKGDILNKKISSKDSLINALKISEGNKTKAAKILNISRRTLYNWMKKYKIDINQI